MGHKQERVKEQAKKEKNAELKFQSYKHMDLIKRIQDNGKVSKTQSASQLTARYTLWS